MQTILTPDLEASCASRWIDSKAKRCFDLLCGSLLLMASLPIMLLAAALINLTSPGPTFFRHKRLGKCGAEISVLKFRTMAHRPMVSGLEVTRNRDCRITTVGRVLRKWKIDELPQFINVLRGEMSMVGPRPDSAKYLERVSPEQRKVLLLKPGITSPATLAFRNEETLFSGVPDDKLEDFYCSTILPLKIRLELDYASQASFVTDLKVLLRTATTAFFSHSCF